MLRYYHENKTKTKQEGPKHILIIDEPELYQHPIRKEAFYNILRSLTNEFQIIYSTHSAKFLSLDKLESLRFFKKTDDNVITQKILYTDVLEKVNHHWDVPRLKKRLNTIETSDFKESLFSKKVILVEGLTDKIILQKISSYMNKDFPTLGISIVNCNGKPGIAEQIPICNILKIPVYVMWDLDTKNNRNKGIFNFLNIQEPETYETTIESKYAHFKIKIENEIKESVGTDKIQKYEKKILSENPGIGSFSYKNSYLVSLLMDEIYGNDQKLERLEDIINKVIAM